MEEKIKIAFIIPSLSNNGPNVFTKLLVDGLKKYVSTIEIFYFNDINEIEMGVKTTRLSFFDKLDFSKFNIVHTTSAKPDLYACFNNKITNKWVSSAHNFYDQDLKLLYGFPKANILSFLWRMAFKRVRHLILSSEHMLEYYSNKFGAKRYSVIPYGIEIDKISELPVNETEFFKELKRKFTIIGSVGLLIKRKGFSQLVDLLVNDDTLCVVIIGEGDYRSVLENEVKKNKLEDRFFLLGFKHNSKDYYRYFDVYVMTSYSEGFGLAMLEAFLQKIPVVCSRLDIYKEYFNDNNVCQFDLDDLQSLQSALTSAIQKKEFYQKNGFKLYEERFSLDAMVRQHINFYKGMLR